MPGLWPNFPFKANKLCRMQETCFSITDNYKISNHCLRLGKPQQRKPGKGSKSYAPSTEDVRNSITQWNSLRIAQVLSKSLDIHSGSIRWRWLALKQVWRNAHGKIYFQELTLWPFMQGFCLLSSLKHFLMEPLNWAQDVDESSRQSESHQILTWVMHDSS